MTGRVVVAAALGLSGAAMASTQMAVGTLITSYGSYTNGAYINFSPAIPGLEACSYTNGNEVWIDFTTADGKTMYATFMAATLAGRAIGFGVSGCASNGIPLVYRVDVQ